MFNRHHIKIAHPEWLAYSDPYKTLDIYRKGLLPPSIAGWMIVVSLKHPLRAIYGSDLRAAIALLGLAIANRFDDLWFSIKLKLGLIDFEDEDIPVERREKPRNAKESEAYRHNANSHPYSDSMLEDVGLISFEHDPEEE